MKPRISLAMITRNEEKNLPEALRSVQGVVDEVVIVDTGSTDGTIRIARAWGARVLSVPWEEDFARARNAALPHIRGDWLLWMDADERLVPESRPFFDLLPEQADPPIGFRVYLRNWTEDRRSFDLSWAMRLVRLFPGLAFTGRVHEQLSSALARHGGVVLDSPVVLDHFGYGLSAEQMRLKLERNFRLLAQQIKEEPHNAYAHLTMGLNRLSAGDFGAAVRHFRLALRLRQGLDSMLLLAAHNGLARAYLEQGELEQAYRWARRSLRLEKSQACPYLVLGDIYRRRGQRKRAYAVLQSALQYGPERSRAAYDINPHRPALYETILGLALELGRYEEARLFLERLWVLKPERAIAEWRYRMAVACGAPAQQVLEAYEALLGFLEREAEADAPLHLLLAEGRLAEAAGGYEMALCRFPNAPLLLRRLAGVRVKLGDLRGAHALLSEGLPVAGAIKEVRA
jgi:glycosyltransferase involved in cell wall biosynthesis